MTDKVILFVMEGRDIIRDLGIASRVKGRIPMKVVNKSFNPLPKYETAGAAGMDVRSNVNRTINPGETCIIPTGLYVAVPMGYELQVRPRSGLSLKSGIRVANSPGTIDSDYRGEIGVILWNTGEDPLEVRVGDRIAQLVMSAVYRVEFDAVTTLDDTARGSGGFGSTGLSATAQGSE